MKQRDKAKVDWLAGMSVKDISDKYNISQSTIRSWVSRHFKPELAKKNEELQLQKINATLQQDTKVATDSKANKGGAPIGNTNSLKHGATALKYIARYKGLLKEDVINQTFDELGMDSEQVLIYKIMEYQLQESYFLDRIRIVSEYTVGEIVRRQAEYLNPLYVELSKVQRSLVQAVRTLESIRATKYRLDMESIRMAANLPEEGAEESSNLLEMLDSTVVDTWADDDDE